MQMRPAGQSIVFNVTSDAFIWVYRFSKCPPAKISSRYERMTGLKIVTSVAQGFGATSIPK
jgi:hypothetical protein